MRLVGGAAGDSVVVDSVMQVVEVDGRCDPVIGVVKLSFSFSYYSCPAAPGDIDDLLSVGATLVLVGGVNETVP